MATKKDFDKIGNFIQNATGTKASRPEASEQEKKARADALKTQGRKGCKAIRINMAFTPENHKYIAIMARISGKTMTGYCNYVVEQYRKEHADLYAKAKDIIDQM